MYRQPLYELGPELLLLQLLGSELASNMCTAIQWLVQCMADNVEIVAGTGSRPGGNLASHTQFGGPCICKACSAPEA